MLYSGAHLCDSKGDVAHVEAASLSGHLAANNGHRGGGDSQAVWGHGWQEGRSWNLACSCKGRAKAYSSQQANYIKRIKVISVVSEWPAS